MFNKLYEYLKKFIKQNIIEIIIFVAMLVFTIIPLPYYVNMPGGLINTKDRVKIDNEYKVGGSYNLTYVSEIRATPIFYVLSKINKNWDLVSINDIKTDNQTLEEAMLYNKLLLETANNNAVEVAYKKANKEIQVEKKDFIVAYLASNNTTLMVGDKITKIDNIEVTDLEQIQSLISNYNANDTVNIEVIRDGKIKLASATLYKEENRTLIGINILINSKLSTNPSYEYNFDKKESGPSGGLMTALTIYNKLISEDLTHNLVISGTGTIDSDGTVGSIGGVKYKIKGAVKNKADVFLVPSGENYKEAIKLKKKYNYNIDIVSISTFDDAINYLKSLK